MYVSVSPSRTFIILFRALFSILQPLSAVVIMTIVSDAGGFFVSFLPVFFGRRVANGGWWMVGGAQ